MPAQTAPPGQTAAPSGPEVNTHDLPATFTSRVNLVLVRVVVRDHQGHAIGTLKKEDFRLTDRGKPQVISRFSVEKTTITTEVKAPPVSPKPNEDSSDTPLPPTPGRFVAYLFDDVHLTFGDLVQARDAARRQLADSLKPDGRAAIYTTSGITTLDFTDDLKELNETLLQIRPHPRAGPRGTDCPDLNYYMADLIQRNDVMAVTTATNETLICANLDPTTMRNVAESMARSAASRVANIGESETRLALGVLKDVVRRVSAMPGQRSVILVSPGFLVPPGVRFESQELVDRALRSNVVISALDARGLYVILPGGDASQRSISPAIALAKSQYEKDAIQLDADIMAEIADSTGGTFVQNSNDFDGGFKRLAAAPEYYYVLAFAPQSLKYDGSYHNLKVSLVDSKGLMLQARRGYYAPKHSLDEAERTKEEIQEALFSRDEMKDIPIGMHLQFFKSSDVAAKLSVVAHVDIAHLRFRKVDDRNNDTLTVVSGVFDRNGNMISAITKTIEMRLKDQTLATILGPGLNVKTTFDVTPGTYVVRLVVRDSEAQTLAASNGAVEIP